MSRLCNKTLNIFLYNILLQYCLESKTKYVARSLSANMPGTTVVLFSDCRVLVMV